MLDQRAWDQIADVITSEDLYRADHRLIFRAVAELRRAQPAARRRHRQRAPATARSARVRGRLGLPRATRARHAERCQHPRLCTHRPRPRDAAQAHRDRRRYRGQRSFHGRAHGLRDRGSRGATRVRDRRRRYAARFGLPVAEIHSAEDDRSDRLPEPLHERYHRRVDGLRRDGQDYVGVAAGRAHHHRGPAVDGQNHARDQHRGERRARQQGAGRRSSAWRCRASSFRSAC